MRSHALLLILVALLVPVDGTSGKDSRSPLQELHPGATLYSTLASPYGYPYGWGLDHEVIPGMSRKRLLTHSS